MKIPPDVNEMLTTERVVHVATSDAAGTPHLAAAKGLSVLDDEHLGFEDWFCMQTLKNLEENRRIAVSVLDPAFQKGYQLIGVVEKEVATEMLDGYAPEAEEKLGRIPQAKHQLRIRVEKVLGLSTGPHSDE